MSFAKKINVKTLVICVALILVAVVGVLLIVRASDGLTNTDRSTWSLKKINDKNLYQTATFSDDTDGFINQGDYGVVVQLDEDNVISAAGSSTSDYSYVIGTMTLEAGKDYVFDSSLKNGSASTVFMSIVKSSDDSIIKSSYSTPVKISGLDASTNVKIVLTVKNDANIDVTLRPVICESSNINDVVSFYK